MKKLISLLTVLVLSLQMTTAFADGATATVSKVTAAPGETVEVDIVLDGCNPYDNIGLQVSYDDSALTLLATEAPDESSDYQPLKKLDKIPYAMVWYGDGEEDIEYNGVIATLTFQIAEDAAEGEYVIDLDYRDSQKGYVDGEDWNYSVDGTPLNLTYVDGSITVAKPAPAGPTLTAAKDGNSVSITATGVEVGGKFIVAGYDANGLVDVEVIDAAATATASVDGDTIKVMWWNNLTDLNSIAPAVEL